jgi:hypothetical protein
MTQPKRKPRVSEALTERRVGELLRIRLDGAEWWDICEFVREKEQEAGSAWHLADGESPLSHSQIRRLLAKADAEVQASHVRSRRKLVRSHLAQRRNMYAKAMLAGDIRTALACKKDEAEMLGLYPPKRIKGEFTGKNGSDLIPPDEVPDAAVRSSALDALHALVGRGNGVPPGNGKADHN